MNLKRFLTASILLAALVLAFSACKLDSKTTQPFVIYVDSLKVPDVITANVLFRVKLYGTIGPNGCYKLEKLYTYPTPQNEVIIEPWGLYIYDGTPCTTGVTYLKDSVDVNISATGVYTLKVLRPDYTFLDKVITVN